MFRPSPADLRSNDRILALLERLVRRNVVLISHGHIPPLYQSGVYYEKEPPGQDNWLDCEETLRAGKGDCEDLGCWLAGQLRANGDHRARAVVKDVRPGLKHVQVRDGRNRLLDPSRVLGMGRRIS